MLIVIFRRCVPHIITNIMSLQVTKVQILAQFSFLASLNWFLSEATFHMENVLLLQRTRNINQLLNIRQLLKTLLKEAPLSWSHQFCSQASSSAPGYWCQRVLSQACTAVSSMLVRLKPSASRPQAMCYVNVAWFSNARNTFMWLWGCPDGCQFKVQLQVHFFRAFIILNGCRTNDC